jgi:hypothetical protein
MTRKYINESKTHAARLLSEAMENKNTFDDIIPFVDYLQRQGAVLHTRYENMCNGFPWDKDNTFTEKYEQKTDKLEKTLLKNAQEFGIAVTNDVNEKRDGIFIRIQGDPRGWPIELIVNRRTVSLGGGK